MKELFRQIELHSHVISLVGAGGKTTTMEALADYLSKQGHQVLMTTTTHIRRPSLSEDQLIEEENLSLIMKKRERHKLIALGLPLLDHEHKWQAPSMDFLEKLPELFDYILCEGDGSKCQPLKIPRKKEPVLFPKTDTVLGLMGLSSLHQPVESSLFGYKEASDELKEELLSEGSFLNTRHLYKIASAPYGLHKNVTTENYHILLNQADLISEEDRSEIYDLMNLLKNNGIESTLCSMNSYSSIPSIAGAS